LRVVPLEKDGVISKIEYNIIAWDEGYKGSPLADLQALMSHLKVLVTRLEGDSPSPARLSPWLLKHVRSSSSLKLLAQKPMMGLPG
jgi:hypothetical protein